MGYPPGAKDDPNAPYNRTTKNVTFSFSLSDSSDIDVDSSMEGDSLHELISSYLRQKYGSDIEIDNLIIDE